jgi:hypothetical protein
MIRAELPDATLIYASTGEIAEDADLLVRIDEGGGVRSESSSPSKTETATPAKGEGDEPHEP